MTKVNRAMMEVFKVTELLLGLNGTAHYTMKPGFSTLDDGISAKHIGITDMKAALSNAVYKYATDIIIFRLLEWRNFHGDLGPVIWVILFFSRHIPTLYSRRVKMKIPSNDQLYPTDQT